MNRIKDNNKANLRDLIAATNVVILLKLDPNHRFFSCVTLKNNRAPLYHIKLYASLQSHGWIQTWVTVRECSIWVNIGDFWPVWPWNLMEDLEKQYGTTSILRQALCIISKAWVYLKWSYSPEALNLGQKLVCVTLKFYNDLQIQ